ncbi:MAG: hypothetical protein F4X16_12620 [Caldilineaceae bacterium SB0661_bin_34]|nr:hypothetical protein [Caldilineaceae bacterium SB0661_bin_34]
MKNITVSIDETTHRIAHIRAAELDRSVSALVREFLRSLVQSRPVPARDEAQPTVDAFASHRRTINEVVEEIRARNSGFSAADNLSREELYDRNRARREVQEADSDSVVRTQHAQG